MTSIDRDLNNIDHSYLEGRRRLKIVLVSLVRAVVKSIPILGSGLDQAWFGTMQAIRDEKARHILEELGRELLPKSEPRGLTSTSYEKLLSETELKFRNQPRLATQMARLLESLEPNSFRALAKSLAEFDRMYDDSRAQSDEVGKLMGLVEKFNTIASINIGINMFPEVSHFEDLENAAREVKDFGRESDFGGRRRALEKIVYELHSNRHIGTIVETESSIWRAAQMRRFVDASESPGTSIAVDFTEIFGHAFAKLDPRPTSSFNTYMFERPSERYLILPGSFQKLRHFVARLETRLLDRIKIREKLLRDYERLFQHQREVPSAVCLPPEIVAEFIRSHLVDLTLLIFPSGSDSPFRRILGLFESGIIAPLPEDRLTKFDQKAIDATERLFNEVRPNLSENNCSDAADVMWICKSNIEREKRDQAVVLVSSSIIKRRIGEKILSEQLSKMADFKEGFDQRFFDSRECAYVCYSHETDQRMRAQTEQADCLITDFHEFISKFSVEIVEKLIAQIRSQDVPGLLENVDYCANVVSNVGAYRNRLIVPFYESVLACVRSDRLYRPKTSGVGELLLEFDEACDQLIDSLTSLSQYLQELQRA